MATFTTSNIIFDGIRDQSNPQALQKFVDAINRNSYANATWTALAAKGDVVLQLVSPSELSSLGAGAVYDPDRSRMVARGDKFAVLLDETWFKDHQSTNAQGQTVTVTADWAITRASADTTRLSLTIHEADHALRQPLYDESAKLRTDPSYRPELTGTERVRQGLATTPC